MSKDIKRYFKECQYLFAYCGKKERNLTHFSQIALAEMVHYGL